MSTCAAMLVRDEADIIEVTVRHLLWHVDEVIVADNRSVDGTREILEGLPVDLRDDPEPGHWQDRKTTAMAMDALERGHEWVVPCDADEIWHSVDPEQRIADWLTALPREVTIVKADVFDHVPTADDPREENPVERIGFRRIRPKKRKVACRLTPDLRIMMGNHKTRTSRTAPTVTGLILRHFPLRTEEQMVRKIRNGIEALTAAEGVSPRVGLHWRRYDGRSDEFIREDFRCRIFSECPAEDDSLTYDPAPQRGLARRSDRDGRPRTLGLDVGDIT